MVVEVKQQGEGGAVDQPAGFDLHTQLLGPLPIVNAFCDRLGLPGLFEAFLPADDARLRLASVFHAGADLGVVRE